MRKQIPVTRMFATEFKTISHRVKDESEKFNPVWHFTGTGVAVNKIMVAGVVLSVEGRTIELKKGTGEFFDVMVMDPTGQMKVSVTAWNKEMLPIAKKLESPSHIIIIGKPQMDQPEGYDRPFLKILPTAMRTVSLEEYVEAVEEIKLATVKRLLSEPSAEAPEEILETRGEAVSRVQSDVDGEVTEALRILRGE